MVFVFKWLSIAAGFFLALSSVSGVCQQERVRKSWDDMSDAEIKLYKDAMASAMDSGAYIRLVEVHQELDGLTEAHNNCMFFYWHRMYLLVYENMLRAQGPQYECVTIPYWDYVNDEAKQATGQCSGYQCSKAMQAMQTSQSTSFPNQLLIINGVTVGLQAQGYCVSDYPLNHFCHNRDVTGNACSHCVTRADWMGRFAIFDDLVSLKSIKEQLFTKANNINEVRRNIEDGAHISIHSMAGGAMVSLGSPSDIAFWSHHGAIDMLLSIWAKCKVGEKIKTYEEKMQENVAWTTCYRNEPNPSFPGIPGKATTVAYKRDDPIAFNCQPIGKSKYDARTDTLLKPFINGLPNLYIDYMNIRDLGQFSYSYKLNNGLKDLYENCGGTGVPTTAPPPVTTKQPTPPPTTTRQPTPPPPTTTIPTATPAVTTKVPVPTTTKSSGLQCNYEGQYFNVCRNANAWSYENGAVCVGITRCVSQSPPYGIVIRS